MRAGGPQMAIGTAHSVAAPVALPAVLASTVRWRGVHGGAGAFAAADG
jgi:hypothetical protein